MYIFYVYEMHLMPWAVFVVKTLANVVSKLLQRTT